MRGRRPAGAEYVDKLDGSAEEKKRLRIIMQTMTGELRLLEACRLLGVSPQRFHQLRDEAMQGALAGLAPRPKGRPPQTLTAEQQRLAELERQLAAAKFELRAAQAREEIALVLPRVVQQPEPEKKNAPARPETPAVDTPVVNRPLVKTPAADTPAVTSMPDPWLEEEHVQRLQTLCDREPPVIAAEFVRRGFSQQPRRRLEHDLRGRIVTLSDYLDEQGYTLAERADLFQLSARTLRSWHHLFSAQVCAGVQAPPHLLGRPVLRAPVAERKAVIDLLKELGPATGLPTLRARFRSLRRAELEDLLRRYRRVWRRRYHEAMHILSWKVPGSVWAMDFTEVAVPIDGLFPYLLAVRDLASGQTLLWQPLVEANADETCRCLAMLFARYGAPLVLKSDNGSPFGADTTRDLLDSASVIPLFSPPHYPQYNGAAEAGIGSLTTRTYYHAARNDRPAAPTCDDVAAAQTEANTTARPQGPTGPTPDQLWANRPTLTASQRLLFQDAVQRHRQDVYVEQGQPFPGTLGQMEERAMDRIAIQRALVEHVYLLFSRRRIPLPFRKKKVAKIT